MMSGRFRRVLLGVAGLLVALGYLPGLSGALYYDDYSNLDGLGDIVDMATALEFVFGGHAGPLGRPIALLSFLPFAQGWPDNSHVALAFNLLIHVSNFFLIYCFGVLFLRRAGYVNKGAVAQVALIAAFLWAILPLLASTTLILIQRMTGLSVFFGLLGLVGFVYSYRWTDHGSTVWVFVQLGVLGLGTVLAVLSKESGALIPVFALLVDVCVRDDKCESRKIYVIRRSALLVILAIVLYQISPFNISYFIHSDYRGFSAAQRVVTEVIVLWEYLFRAFVPQQPTAFGPFHDYYSVHAADGVFYLALMGWVLLFALSFALRRKVPLLLFALAWFAVGHIIESTTILLELYFEHRNYLAVYGACLFIVWAVYALSVKFGRVLWVGLAAYLLIMWSVLFMMTSLWGDKSLAAETWAAKHPGSARAALHAVFVELGAAPSSDEHQGNKRFIERERQDYALKVLDRTMNACSDCVDIRLQALVFSCQLGRAEELETRLEDILSIARSGVVTPSVISSIFDLVGLVSDKKCAHTSTLDVRKLFHALRQNPAFSYTMYSGKLYFAEAMLAESAGDWELVKELLSKGEKVAPDTIPILQYQVYAAVQSKDFTYGYSAVARRGELIGKWEKPKLKLLLRSLVEQLNSESEANKVVN